MSDRKRDTGAGQKKRGKWSGEGDYNQDEDFAGKEGMIMCDRVLFGRTGQVVKLTVSGHDIWGLLYFTGSVQ